MTLAPGCKRPLARQRGVSFQELADEAFANPVGLRAALRGKRWRPKAGREG